MSGVGYRRHHDFQDDGEPEGKRRRGPQEYNEIERKLQDLIARVGEKCGGASLESNLEGLCNVLEADLERYKTKILDVMSVCVALLPEKLTIYSTLAGLLNAKNYNFGGDIVEKMTSLLHEKLTSYDFEHALHIILFLADMGNCKVLTLTSVIDFLESLLQCAFEEGVPQVRTDWFVYAVLHALPWIGSELNDKKHEELNNLLEGLQKYIEQRKKDHVLTLRVWYKDTPHEQEDYIDCLWNQLKQLKTAGWKDNHIRRPYVAFDATLQDALHHNLPSFSPPSHSENAIYPTPSVIFRLFDYADCTAEDGSVLPGAHSIERFLVEAELSWIMKSYFHDRRQCAEELLSLSKEYNVPMIHMIIEVVFGEMFRLPVSSQPVIFYGSVLIEMCKMRPNNVPPVLALAAELLYQRVGGMQPACIDRFVDWFSFHLSNFEYRWTWEDWSDCLENTNWNPKFIFVREVLEKCMRLSYYDRIQELVAKCSVNFERVLPPKPDIRYLLDDETDPNFDRARTFSNLFQDRAPDDVMLAEIKSGEDFYNPEYFGVFFAVLLKLAAKSYSHNFAALTKYHHTLKEIADKEDVSEEMQEVLLKTLYSCWKTNHQMIIILVDKLLKMQILDCCVVVQWIFSDDMKDELDRQWMFEILNTALIKLSRHISKVRREVQIIEKKMAKNKEEQESGDVEMENTTEDEEELEKQNKKLSELIDFQKNLFLDVLHKFTIVLTEHMEKNMKQNKEFRDAYYTWIEGRLNQVFLVHAEELRRYRSDVGVELFDTDAVDPQIRVVYKQFCSLSL